MAIFMRCGVAVAAALLAFGAAGLASAGPLEQLPGRWSGWGEIIMENGKSERVKCIATYTNQGSGSDLRHSMRCASPNYKVDAVAELKVTGQRVSGEWNERIWSNTGAISGTVSHNGIIAHIVGQSFEANLNVETGICKQVLAINPKGMGVRRIRVNLAKC